MEFKTWIRRLRGQGLIVDTAERYGVSKSTWSAWETGRRVPTDAAIFRLFESVEETPDQAEQLEILRAAAEAREQPRYGAEAAA